MHILANVSRLTADYPRVSPNYADHRCVIATEPGLGRKPTAEVFGLFLDRRAHAYQSQFDPMAASVKALIESQLQQITTRSPRKVGSKARAI